MIQLLKTKWRQAVVQTACVVFLATSFVAGPLTMPLLAAGVALLLWIAGRNAGAARWGRTG